MTITLEAIRAAGGIVHSDGNIFFRDISMLQGLAGAAPAAVAPQGVVAWMHPGTLDVIHADRKHEWATRYGSGGHSKAEGYTVALVRAGEPAAAALIPAVLEQIAQGWDGCKYDAPGETLDIGADIRSAAARLLAGPALVSIPHELLVRAVNSLGAFVSEHGWAQTDMDTLDDLCAAMPAADLAAAHNLSPAPAAPAANPGDLVAVPRDLIGSACAAIDKKRDAPKTLAELRRYTTGDLSRALEAPAASLRDAAANALAALERTQHASDADRLAAADQLRAALAAAPQAPRMGEDALHLLRRLLSNQHTLTGPEFRSELEKIVAEEFARHAAAPQAPAAPVGLPWRTGIPQWTDDRAVRVIAVTAHDDFGGVQVHDIRASDFHTDGDGDGAEVARLCTHWAYRDDIWPRAEAAAPAAPAVDAQAERDAAFEAVRNRLCGLQRYSFVLDDDGVVRRAQDRTGNWIEFDDAHALFDPVAVDAARAAQAKEGGAA